MLTRRPTSLPRTCNLFTSRRVSRSVSTEFGRTVGPITEAPALVKRPKEKFYNLSMSKNEGPYLCRDGVTLTHDPKMAWLGNEKAVAYARRAFAIAFVMEAVPTQPRGQA